MIKYYPVMYRKFFQMKPHVIVVAINERGEIFIMKKPKKMSREEIKEQNGEL